MGSDVQIYFECDEVPDGLFLPEGCSIKTAEGYELEYGATHEVFTQYRYYGYHSESGNWPEISAILLSLFGNPKVKRVWYYGTYDDPPTRPFAPEHLLNITAHYLKKSRPK